MGKKIGLVGGSYKPLHVGHWSMITRASDENDVVHLYVSIADRDNIKGYRMEFVWDTILKQHLPKNVVLHMDCNPVREIYELLGKANEAGATEYNFRVYSDPKDIAKKFPMASRKKYFGDLVKRRKVRFIPIKREGIHDISGTRMREFLNEGNKREFKRYLPKCVDRDAFWDALQPGTITDIVKERVRFLAEALPDETDWLIIKKQLIVTLRSRDRAGFTRRHDTTRRHMPFNGFEKAIRSYWHELTGNTLILPEDKWHVKDDPEAYI